MLDDAVAMVAASRGEQGCVSYSLTVDLIDPDVLWINERFVDADALAVHRQSDHMAVWRKSWQAVAGVERDMRYYCNPSAQSTL